MPLGTGTWALINSTTLSSTTNTIVFNNIPQFYRDLRVIYAGKNGANNGSYYMSNWISPNDSASNIFTIGMYTFGGNYDVLSGKGTGNNFDFRVHAANGSAYGGSTADQAQYKLDFMNYSSSTKQKGINTYNSAEYEALSFYHFNGYQNSLTPVNSLTLTAGVNPLQIGTTFFLYGIR